MSGHILQHHREWIPAKASVGGATDTLEDAVRAGNEYLQIQTAKTFSYRNSANVVGNGEEETEKPEEITEDKPIVTQQWVAPVAALPVSPKKEELSYYATVTLILQKVLEKLEGMQRSQSETYQTPITCFKCGLLGHLAPQCLRYPGNRTSGDVRNNRSSQLPQWEPLRNKNRTRTSAGNADRPQ